MIKARPGTVAASIAKAEVPSLSFQPRFGAARDLQRGGRSTTSKDKLIQMSNHA
jgi:hypothetical protein